MKVIHSILFLSVSLVLASCNSTTLQVGNQTQTVSNADIGHTADYQNGFRKGSRDKVGGRAFSIPSSMKYNTNYATGYRDGYAAAAMIDARN